MVEITHATMQRTWAHVPGLCRKETSCGTMEQCCSCSPSSLSLPSTLSSSLSVYLIFYLKRKWHLASSVCDNKRMNTDPEVYLRSWTINKSIVFLLRPLLSSQIICWCITSLFFDLRSCHLQRLDELGFLEWNSNTLVKCKQHSFIKNPIIKANWHAYVSN